MSREVIKKLRKDAADLRVRVETMVPTLRAIRERTGTTHCREWNDYGDEISALEHEARRLDELADQTEARMIRDELGAVLAKHPNARRSVLRRSLEALKPT